METTPQFDRNVYRRIGYDELVVFAGELLSESGQEVTFENLVAKCFECFPERFALRGYPQWPDSAVVNKSWLRCRTDKGYLTGSVKDGFRLTPRGVEAAAKVHRVLTGQRKYHRAVSQKLTEQRTREGRFLRSLEQSRAYTTFTTTKDFSAVSDFDICDMLLCTLDSSPSTRSSNLNLFKHAAEFYRRTDILQFLSDVEHRYGHLFRTRVSGGMMSRT